MYAVIILPFVYLGSQKANTIIQNKMKAKKGYVNVLQISKTGRYQDLGFAIPQDDGLIKLKNKKTKIDINLPYDKEATFINKYNCPAILYSPSKNIIDVNNGGTYNIQMSELDNILANVYNTALASIRRNMTIDKMTKILMIGASCLAAGVAWYYGKDIPEILELMKSAVGQI